MQSEDLPKYQGGSLGSFREGLQMLPNAALKVMGKDKVSARSSPLAPCDTPGRRRILSRAKTARICIPLLKPIHTSRRTSDRIITPKACTYEFCSFFSISLLKCFSLFPSNIIRDEFYGMYGCMHLLFLRLYVLTSRRFRLPEFGK